VRPGSPDDVIVQDRQNFLNFFIYLTDVTPETGCHTYIRGSEPTRPMTLRRDGRYPDEEIAAAYRPEDHIEICGPRGTVFVAHTKGIHKGKMLRRDNRLVLQYIFTTDLFGAPWKPLAWTETMESGLGELARTHPRLFRRFGLWS